MRREIFSRTASKGAEFRQAALVSDAGLTALGTAVAPKSPTFPNWFLIIPATLGLGFGLGTLMAVFMELFNRRVRGIEDLQSALDVPVVGVIGGTASAVKMGINWRPSFAKPVRRRAVPA